MATANELDETLECSICKEVLKDPRILPCEHTFCLECIKKWSVRQLTCPVCRTRFDDLPMSDGEAIN